MEKDKLIYHPIDSTEELKEIMKFLHIHDTLYIEKDIHYDKEKKLLKIVFNRVAEEYKDKIKIKKFFFFFETGTYPGVDSLLQLENVEYFKIITKEDMTKTVFLLRDIKIKDKKVIFRFFDYLKIEISFVDGNIKGFFKDTRFTNLSDDSTY